MRIFHTKLFILVSLLLGLTQQVIADEITVFAASSLTNVMQQIAQSYEQQHPNDKITFSFAASSTLAKQIEQGAPADLFISADQKWADYLVTKQKIPTYRLLVANSLVLIAPKNSTLAPAPIKHIPFKTLLTDQYLSVGDPDHVPIGRYAKQALVSLNLWETIEPRLARAKNVRNSLLLVERAESPLGIVYSTDAKVSDKVKVIANIPDDTHSPVLYPIAHLNDRSLTQQFEHYLYTQPAQEIFLKAGFQAIKTALPAEKL